MNPPRCQARQYMCRRVCGPAPYLPSIGQMRRESCGVGGGDLKAEVGGEAVRGRLFSMRRPPDARALCCMTGEKHGGWGGVLPPVLSWVLPPVLAGLLISG